MSSKVQAKHDNKVASNQRSSKPPVRDTAAITEHTHPATIIQRARFEPGSLTPRDVLQLQRTIGNQAVQRLLLQAKPADLEARPSTEEITNFAHDLSQIPVHAQSPARVQAKLAVSSPGDAYEQEADRVSEQVMLMPEPQLQRACTCGGGCPKCQTEQPGQEQERLQTKHAGSGDVAQEAVPPNVHEVLRSPGQPLDAATRTFMEPRFRHDFSRVRIHTDAEAAQSAGQLHASAYTLGDRVVFAEGRFAPSTPEGDRLLAHELAHVVQGAGQNPILRRQPDPKGLQAEEAKLRVRIVDTLEATKKTAIDALVSAIDRGDRAYLESLGLTSKEVNHLLNRTPKLVDMTFGRAAEFAVEQAVRADVFLSQYVKRGPQGRVPSGVGKPDWRIETRSSSIPVDLMTPRQVEEKLAMWRRQSKRGKPKHYIEKGLNITYDQKPSRTTPPANVPPAPTPQIAQGVPKPSVVRTAGRFLAREAPGLALQAVLMALFPPGANLHNDKAEELSRTKLDPAVGDALANQEPAYDRLLADDPSKSIYANVKARLDYATGSIKGTDLELYLKDITFIEMKITNEYISSDSKFDTTVRGNAAKQMTYSILLFEPESVTRARAQQVEAEDEAKRKEVAERRERDEIRGQRGMKQ